MTNDILLGGIGFYANHEELAGVVCVKCIQNDGAECQARSHDEDPCRHAGQKYEEFGAQSSASLY